MSVRCLANATIDDVEDLLVAPVRPQAREVLGQAAHRRGVGAPVVVDQDDQRQVVRLGDVVQGLPGHAAGEGAVPDHRDDVPVGAALDDVRLGDPVRPAERGRRVGVLDDVWLGYGAAGVPGTSSLVLSMTQSLIQCASVRLQPGLRGVADGS